jgi:hypothetical protein
MNRGTFRIPDLVNLAVAFLAMGGTRIFYPRLVALSLFLGAILAAANFFVAHLLLQMLVNSEEKRRAVVTVLLGIKLIAFVGIAAAILVFVPIHPTAFALGIGVILLSTAVTTLVTRSAEG